MKFGKKKDDRLSSSNPLLHEQALTRRAPAQAAISKGPEAAREAAWQPPLQRHIKPDDGSEFVTIRIRILNGDSEHDFNAKFNAGPLLGSRICAIISEKEGLPREARKLFALWIIAKDLELQVRPDLDIFSIMDKWNTMVLDYTHYPEAIDPGHPINRHWFVFRREATVTRSQERKYTDPSTVRLLYGEARRNVMTGRYVCTLSDAVALGGMMLAISTGAYDKVRHSPGYIMKHDHWQTLVPRRFYDDLKPEEWEVCLSTEHQKHVGRSTESIRILYLELVREWACYGCSFFPCCGDRPPAGFFEFRLQRWLVGVSSSGLVVMDLDKNGYAFAEQWEDLVVKRTPDRIILRWKHKQTGKEMKRKLFSPQAQMVQNLALRAKYIALKEVHDEAAAAKARQASVSSPPTSGVPSLQSQQSFTSAGKPLTASFAATANSAQQMLPTDGAQQYPQGAQYVGPQGSTLPTQTNRQSLIPNGAAGLVPNVNPQTMGPNPAYSSDERQLYGTQSEQSARPQNDNRRSYIPPNQQPSAPPIEVLASQSHNPAGGIGVQPHAANPSSQRPTSVQPQSSLARFFPQEGHPQPQHQEPPQQMPQDGARKARPLSTFSRPPGFQTGSPGLNRSPSAQGGQSLAAFSRGGPTSPTLATGPALSMFAGNMMGDGRGTVGNRSRSPSVSSTQPLAGFSSARKPSVKDFISQQAVAGSYAAGDDINFAAPPGSSFSTSQSPSYVAGPMTNDPNAYSNAGMPRSESNVSGIPNGDTDYVPYQRPSIVATRMSKSPSVVGNIANAFKTDPNNKGGIRRGADEGPDWAGLHTFY